MAQQHKNTLLLGFLIVLLVLPLFRLSNVYATTAKFGYETIGTAGTASLENRVRGSVFTCTQSGTAISITAYITASATYFGYTKAAIYYHGNLSLLASTTQVYVGDEAVWVTTTFSNSPTLIANTAYVLVAWAQSLAGTCVLSYDAGDTNQGHYQTATYNNFPNPLVPTHDNYKYSIYCTYNIAGQNYVSSLTDNVQVIDSIAKTIRKGFAETVQVADSLAKKIMKGLIETVQITDSLGKHIMKALTETIAVTDSLASKVLHQLVTFIRNETITITDSILTAIGEITAKIIVIGIVLGILLFSIPTLIILKRRG